jgi:hypothetical protein
MMSVLNMVCEPPISTYCFDQSELEQQILRFYVVPDESANSRSIYDKLDPDTNVRLDERWNLNRRIVDIRQFIDTLHAKEMSTIALTYPMASKRLEMFRAMRLNWDIEEDIPATDETIDLAYETLSRLKNMAGQSDAELPEPYVYLLSDGQIEFEWEFKGKEFDLAIVKEKSLAVCSALLRDTNTWVDNEDKVLPDEIGQISTIQTFLSWL